MMALVEKNLGKYVNIKNQILGCKNSQIHLTRLVPFSNAKQNTTNKENNLPIAFYASLNDLR